MKKRFLKYKPGVSNRTLFFLSGLFWTSIGLFLLTKGCRQLLADGSFSPNFFLFLGAGTVGTFKSLYILDRVARKGIERILAFNDSTCVGAVYSIKTWGVVLCMVFMGIVLRKLSLPWYLTGTLFVAIGWALVFSSRLAWSAWKKRL